MYRYIIGHHGPHIWQVYAITPRGWEDAGQYRTRSQARAHAGRL